MAKKKKKAKRKSNRRHRTAGRRKSDQGQPGWLYLLSGLGIGLAVAAYIYLGDVPPPEQLREVVEEKAEAAFEAAAKVEQKVEAKVEEQVEADEFDFDFYEMLPSLDVEVYEEPQAPAQRQAQALPPAPATTPGIYILQAGSFSSVQDANRRKAEMGLIGVRAEIKRGSANNRTVYRVYTQPINNTAEVNRVSQQLNEAGIEVLRKRVSD